MKAKDINISGKAVHREHMIALGCFVVAFCMNIYAIIRYTRPASELWSSIGFVVATAVGIYFILWIVRLLALLVRAIVRKVRK